MNKGIQRKKLLNQEQKILNELTALQKQLQTEIDSYQKDIELVRKHLSDLSSANNNDAWHSYLHTINRQYPEE
jgi:peptidoglycan hydrolase CwlO-like protein